MPETTEPTEEQQYIDDMARRRGYVLDYHKVMVNQDVTFMKACDNLVQAAYLNQRLLDRKTKELIFIVSLIESPHFPCGHVVLGHGVSTATS